MEKPRKRSEELPKRAVADVTSLPPSMAMPSSTMMWLSASAMSYILGPSPGNFAAHIQFPEALMESKVGMRIQHRFVSASRT